LIRRDGTFRGIRDAAARETVLADYVLVKGTKAGELAAKYEVVFGVTPEW